MPIIILCVLLPGINPVQWVKFSRAWVLVFQDITDEVVILIKPGKVVVTTSMDAD